MSRHFQIECDGGCIAEQPGKVEVSQNDGESLFRNRHISRAVMGAAAARAGA